MKKCAICGKSYTVKTVRKKLRGKYNPTTKQRKYPNLQWIRLLLDKKNFEDKVLKKGTRVKACTRCIKALSKRK